MRDLRHEARAEEEERLRRLTERHAGALRLDPVLAAELLGLHEQRIATRASRRVERSEQEIAHAHAALAEPLERSLVEPRAPVLIGELGAHALSELGRDAVGRLAHR